MACRDVEEPAEFAARRPEQREWTIVEWIDIVRNDRGLPDRHCEPVTDLGVLLTYSEVQAGLEALHDEFPERVFAPYRLWPVRMLLERCVEF